jgi:hypothetical protein
LGCRTALLKQAGSAGNLYRLTDPESHFELFAIWKRQSPMEPTVSKLLDVLEKDLGSPETSKQENGANSDRVPIDPLLDSPLVSDSIL